MDKEQPPQETTRLSGEKESTITVKWWQVLSLFTAIFGFFFLTTINHERRITTIETQYSFLTQTIGDVKDTVNCMDGKLDDLLQDTRGRGSERKALERNGGRE